MYVITAEEQAQSCYKTCCSSKCWFLHSDSIGLDRHQGIQDRDRMGKE